MVSRFEQPSLETLASTRAGKIDRLAPTLVLLQSDVSPSSDHLIIQHQLDVVGHRSMLDILHSNFYRSDFGGSVRRYPKLGKVGLLMKSSAFGCGDYERQNDGGGRGGLERDAFQRQLRCHRKTPKRWACRRHSTDVRNQIASRDDDNERCKPAQWRQGRNDVQS